MTVIGLAWCVLPNAASAETKTFDDKEGDAAPRFDILNAAFGNNEKFVSVNAQFLDLKPKGAQFFSFNVRLKGVEGDYAVASKRRADGTITTKLRKYDGDGGHPVDCDVRARWRPGKDLIRVRFPQTCLPQQGRVFISAGTGNDPGGSAEDWTRTVAVPFD